MVTLTPWMYPLAFTMPAVTALSDLNGRPSCDCWDCDPGPPVGTRSSPRIEFIRVDLPTPVLPHTRMCSSMYLYKHYVMLIRYAVFLLIIIKKTLREHQP